MLTYAADGTAINDYTSMIPIKVDLSILEVTVDYTGTVVGRVTTTDGEMRQLDADFSDLRATVTMVLAGEVAVIADNEPPTSLDPDTVPRPLVMDATYRCTAQELVIEPIGPSAASAWTRR